MEYVTIKCGRAFLATKANNLSMCTLGNCLTDDISSGHDRINWILDDQYDHISNNRTSMAKDDDTITIEDLFTENFSSEAAISIPKVTMIDLLRQWDEVCKTNPEEVTIYYENEKFRIEAKEREQA